MTRSVAATGSRRPEFRTLGERLWWARETAPLTQKELAALLGITTRTVQHYENDESRPPLNRLLLWANACDADYDWLAGSAYAEVDAVDPQKRGQIGGRASTATVRSIRRSNERARHDSNVQPSDPKASPTFRPPNRNRRRRLSAAPLYLIADDTAIPA